jgi:hypothetical protein
MSNKALVLALASAVAGQAGSCSKNGDTTSQKAGASEAATGGSPVSSTAGGQQKGKCTAGSAPGEETGRSSMSDTWVFYTRSVGSAGTLGGNFTPEAALVRTDASIPGVPRVGFFRRPMAAGEWERLTGLVRSLGPARSSGAHAPGTPMVSLGIMSKGKAEIVHNQAEAGLSSEERAVFSKVEETVEEVMRHAHRALEAGASWGEASIEPDGEVTLDVAVCNPSLVPVSFAHPGSRGAEPSGLSVVVARVGPDGATVNAQQVVFSGKEVVEMAAGERAPGTPPNVVDLAPGREVSFRARSRVRLVPSDYRASARVDLAPPPGSDEQAVSGTIALELPRLAVVRPGEGGKRR